MWYSAYDRETGRLVSIGSIPNPDLPEHLGLVETEDAPNVTHWNEAQRAYIVPEEPLQEPEPEPPEVEAPTIQTEPLEETEPEASTEVEVDHVQ